MTKYRLITNGEYFRVQERFLFFFWVLFTYGINEGGGSYFIERKTKKEAWEELNKALKEKEKLKWWPV